MKTVLFQIRAKGQGPRNLVPEPQMPRRTAIAVLICVVTATFVCLRFMYLNQEVWNGKCCMVPHIARFLRPGQQGFSLGRQGEQASISVRVRESEDTGQEPTGWSWVTRRWRSLLFRRTVMKSGAPLIPSGDSCPAFTAPVPSPPGIGALLPAVLPREGTASAGTSIPSVPAALHSYGLHPMTWAKNDQEQRSSSTSSVGTWPRMQLRSAHPDRAPSRNASPFAAPLSATLRSDAEIESRLQYHSTCLAMRGPKGTAHSVASGGLASDTPAPLHTLVKDRWQLALHGLELHAAVQSWLALAPTYGYWDGYIAGPTPFHAGPWLEDYWLHTLGQPVIRDMPTQVYAGRTEQQWAALGVHKVKVASSASVDDDGSAAPVQVQLPYDVELFHPWVPLFVPWDAITHTMQQVAGRDMGFHLDPTANAMLCRLSSLLGDGMQEHVQYVTLARRARGPWLLDFEPLAPGSPRVAWPCGNILHNALKNTLVISAGGVGHLPIPLLAREHEVLGCAARPERGTHRNKVVFADTRRAGTRETLWNLPTYEGCLAMFETSDLASPATLSRHEEGRWALQEWGVGDDRNVSSGGHALHLRAMASGLYQLAPRGTGPTSFRLYEALQMGLVPIYVHDGQPWLPYLKPGESWLWVPGKAAHEQSLWARIAHVVRVDDFPAWLAGLCSEEDGESEGEGVETKTRRTAPQHHAEQVAAILSPATRSLFTYEGVMRELHAWLVDPHGGTRLACQPSSFLE